VALISISVALSQTQLILRDRDYGASALCGVLVYGPAFASTKLYRLVTEA